MNGCCFEGHAPAEGDGSGGSFGSFGSLDFTSPGPAGVPWALYGLLALALLSGQRQK